MSQSIYLPELLLAPTSVPPEQAAEEGQLLVGRAVVCTAEHDLLVEYGSRTLRMPREECALGIQEGRTKEIAVLSRVGKPICFKAIPGENGGIIPSRRAAQQEALDYFLRGGVQPGEVLRTVVTHLEPFGVFVDVGCGIVSLIGIRQLSVSRISHPGQRVAMHQELPAAVTGLDREKGHILLSHRELLGTWEENAAGFQPGQTVTGVVRTVEPYGVFVEMTPNLSGLADYREGVRPGDRVSAYIKSILPDRMKIKLVILEKLPGREPCLLRAEDYHLPREVLKRWSYGPEGAGGKRIVTVFGQ